MVIKTTRWSPDTCECVIDYDWDDSIPNDQIVFTPSNIVNTCEAHSTSSTSPSALYTVLTEENPRKNKALQHILDNGPATISDIDENGNKILKKGLDISFTFSSNAPNRIINLSITGITISLAQKNTVQTKLDQRFGAGKVVLS